jgi:hypothetical protein
MGMISIRLDDQVSAISSATSGPSAGSSLKGKLDLQLRMECHKVGDHWPKLDSAERHRRIYAEKSAWHRLRMSK